MADLAQWLTALPLGLAMRRLPWLFPVLQTIHILATGMLLSSAVMISLRLWGVSHAQTIDERRRRYLPWMWGALIVLTLTGIVLIVGNPRSLRDPALPVKLWMMVPAIAAMIVVARAMGGEAYWDKSPGVRTMMSAVATGMLMLWFGVTLAGRGRWIFNVIG
jgi:hypothetical protein